MALSHIFHAITAEAEAEMQALRLEHAAKMQAEETDQKRAIEHARHAITLKKTDRLRSLRSRAEGHVRMKTRHATLRRKQEILDAIYEKKVLSALRALPSTKTESMLKQWIDSIPEKGTILPSVSQESQIRKICGDRHVIGDVIDVAGGFRYIGPTQDREYTYEFLVHEILRPSTEIALAHKMFGIA